MESDAFTPSPAGDARFRSTRWSVVLAAGAAPGPDASRALEVLCAAYWYPLYAFARRRGQDADAAQDLVQGFFARLIEKRDLGAADPARGRFRSYLLATFVHYIAHERDRAAAQKRGGGAITLSLDFPSAEDRYRLEPAGASTPETLYERRWALELLDTVLGRLRREHEEAARAALFDALAGPALTPGGAGAPYRTLAAQLGMSETAVKVAVHRLRRRYRDLIRETVTHTLADPREVEDEIRHLLAALGG